METVEYFNSLSEIESLVNAFNSQQLPKEKWTHEAHLTVAVWYLSRYTLEESICYLKGQIILHNKYVGIENSPTSGYHETFTVFWLKTVKNFVDQSTVGLLATCNNFLKSPMSSKDYPLQFYSHDLLFSTAARAFYLKPDIKAN